MTRCPSHPISIRPISNLIGAAWLCAAGFLAGCASTHAVVAEEDAPRMDAATADEESIVVPADRLRDRSIGVRTGSTPSFYADTPGRRTYGILGVIGMMREGNRLVAAYGLEDPAGALSEDLVASLAVRNGMRTTTQDAADLLLDIKTINWDFRPYRNNADSLFVVYVARISLIDRSSGAVLAQGKCRSRRDREGDSATIEQLLADGAKRLQTELREAAHECAQRVKSETLSAFLPPTPLIARGAATEDRAQR